MGFVGAPVVIGAVGKWESRAFREISKGVWEPVKTGSGLRGRCPEFCVNVLRPNRAGARFFETE